MNYISLTSKILPLITLFVLLSAPSCTLSMTLNDLPQQLKEEIVKQVVQTSDTKTQSAQTLTNWARTSKQWSNFLRPLFRKEIHRDDREDKFFSLENAFDQRKEQAKQELLTFLKKISIATEEELIFTCPLIGYKIQEALSRATQNIFDPNDAANLLQTLIIPLEKGVLSLNCLEAFLELYRINQNTYTTTCTRNKTNYDSTSDRLFLSYVQEDRYPDTLDYKKRYDAQQIRIKTIITTLQKYNIFHCSVAYFTMVDDYPESYLNQLKQFLNRPDCTQEDITFLNTMIPVKKILLHGAYNHRPMTKEILLAGAGVSIITYIIAIVLYYRAHLLIKPWPLRSRFLYLCKVLTLGTLTGITSSIICQSIHGPLAAYLRYRKSDGYKIIQRLNMRGLNL